MNPSISRRTRSGFSLIEVLIAVVVLSFGLLALTALQSRLFQASAEAKAQSIALSMAKAQIEDMRSYMSMDGYRTLADGSDAALEQDGTSFTRSWTVQRYAVAQGGTSYQAYGTDTGLLPATFEPNREFKTVEVAVSWTDASGQTRTVRMEDAIAGIDPQDSARNQRSRSGRSRGPKVMIWDPESEQGVIPIAMGDGSETAATNPKPILAGRQDQSVIETRFDVITYAGLSGGVAQAQARVETNVVGCKCTLSQNSSSVYYRPTYWNGQRYVTPEAVQGRAPARAATLGNNDPPQSRYCDACCRDHHDVSVASGKPKVSPYRASHTHQLKENGVWRDALPGETYFEACRLIRVDGIFDVAADLSNDVYNLLETADSAMSPAPSAAGKTAYESFVLDYLQRRYVSGTANGYNSRLAATEEQLAPLNVPESISIAPRDTERWLHSRGLYVDYLEQEARDAIVDAKSACRGATGEPTANELRTCVLKVLPFTSINLTEIADWFSSATAQIRVSNNDFATAEVSTDPVKGGVSPGTQPSTGATPLANTIAGHSTSGLLGIVQAWPINAEEDPASPGSLARRDAQQFVIGDGPPPSGSGGRFYVNFAPGYSPNASSPPVISFDMPSRFTCNVSAGGMNHVCLTQSTLGSGVPLRIEKYNLTASDLRANPCQSNKNESMPYRIVYDVLSVTSSNQASNVQSLSVFNNNAPGPYAAGEYTQTQVNPVSNNDVMTVTMSSPTFLCPSSYTCAGPGNNTVVYSEEFTTCASNVRPDAAPVGQ